MTRQKILITGASSGLGAGMAREFAAKGRDLALCARRTDRLDELKAELLERHPGITVAVAALDVNDHEQVPKVFAELSDELGGIDRVIVNAGIGKGAPLGSGKLWANKATIETNLVAALVQIETAIEMFKAAGGGHLVLISSVLGNKGVPGVQGRLRRQQGGGVVAGRVAARRVRQGPDQGDGARARLHRVGDDREGRHDDADGRQRDRRQGDGRRDRTRTGPCRRAELAVDAAGAGAEVAAAAVRQRFA